MKTRLTLIIPALVIALFASVALPLINTGVAARPNAEFTPPAFCPSAGDTRLVVFSDDLESGSTQWTLGDGNGAWATSTTVASSPTHSLYAAGDVVNNARQASIHHLTLLPQTAYYLYFSHYFDFEEGDYDGGVLQYSTNGGSTWINAQGLFSAGQDYTGTLFGGTTNPLEGEPAFTEQSTELVASRYDLSSLAGQTISLRWQVGTDYNINSVGWYVDDVSLYRCVPTPFNTKVYIQASEKGSYTIPPATSTRDSYAENLGPVKVSSENGSPIIASERVAYTPDGGTTWTTFAEMMGMPENQLTDRYVFPWYNNTEMNTQIRFGNMGTTGTWVTVKIGGVEQGSYYLSPNQSWRQFYPENNGPVEVYSSDSVPIVASMRFAYIQSTSPLVVSNFTEIMGMPFDQLTDSYVFPWYNNTEMNTQLRFGNVGTSPTWVTVKIAGVEKGSYYLLPNQSWRQFYPENNGPVEVYSSDSVPIVASMRFAYIQSTSPLVVTAFSEIMGFPKTSLASSYWFPIYDNVTHNMQLRFGNMGTSGTWVTVKIAGVEKGSYYMLPNQSLRLFYAENNGPVEVSSSGGVPLVASMRFAYIQSTSPLVVTDFTELKGLPYNQLTDTYVFPWYNNLEMDTQVRIAVP